MFSSKDYFRIIYITCYAGITYCSLLALLFATFPIFASKEDSLEMFSRYGLLGFILVKMLVFVLIFGCCTLVVYAMSRLVKRKMSKTGLIICFTLHFTLWVILMGSMLMDYFK